MLNRYSTTVSLLNNDLFDPFEYLKVANEFLSNPMYETQGRDLVIRALDRKQKFGDSISILKMLVRKAGLFPYLQSEFHDHSIDEEYALDIYRSEHLPRFVYHSLQLKIINLLNDGQNIVLSAPTSMGKSAIVDSLLAASNYKRVVIVVPTIALIDETRRRITKRFSGKYDIITHSSQKSNPKKSTIFILTQERVNERNDIELIDLFVIDEFYKLSFQKEEPDSRTVALNICLSKLLLVSKQFYLIGPSIDEVRGLNKFGKNYVFIPASFNTVSVNVTEYNIGANSWEEKIETTKNILSNSNSISQQTIIYCRSPNTAASIASELIRAGLGKHSKSDYSEWVKAHYSDDWAYYQAITSGIGIHHGALPRAIQQYTVDLFNAKRISILICTSTIIEGVNTNAETVVIFDNRNGTSSIDRFTHNNIKGRAGRMNIHFVGNVHCLERLPTETVESKIVEIPLGLQTQSSPLNLLAAIDEAHVQDDVAPRLKEYLSSSPIPIPLLRKHATYKLEVLERTYEYLNKMPSFELRKLIAKRPNADHLSAICAVLRIAEHRSLQLLNLAGQESDLKVKVSNYLFASSYQEYLDSAIAWNNTKFDDPAKRTEALDRDLKIIRSVFEFAIPRSMYMLQDILNWVIDSRKLDGAADFGFIIGKFENSHLPGALSALEEMGIPVQTLAKIADERLAGAELNVLIRYLRSHFYKIRNLTRLDKRFFERALVKIADETSL
jgi:superfamily II DNA/RNA helicase